RGRGARRPPARRLARGMRSSAPVRRRGRGPRRRAASRASACRSPRRSRGIDRDARPPRAAARRARAAAPTRYESVRRTVTRLALVRAGGTIAREHGAGARDVGGDRAAEGVRPAEGHLAAQALDQLDAEPGPVEVAREVEQVDLDRPPPPAEG